MPKLTGFDRSPIPGPPTLPLFGPFLRFASFLDDPVGTILALPKYGEVAAVVDQNPAIVCVFGAELNREVLTNPDRFHNPEDFFSGPPGSARDRMRAMVITTNGDNHKRLRRLIQPAFQRSALEGYAADITSLTGELLDSWPQGEVAPVDALCRELALSIAIRCFYGIDVQAEARELGRTLCEFVRIITSPANILLPLDLPGLPYRRGVELGEQLAARMMALVEQKRARGGEARDVMALVLSTRDETGRGLSTDELMALAVELFIAGSETTTATLTWAVFLLDQHPKVLEAVEAEVEGVLGDRPPTPADLPKLELLDRVVKETMRVLPTAPALFMRVAAEDTRLGGKAIPKGANVVVAPLIAHHDPLRYPEPRRFLPERWRDLDPSPYEYLPFGGGPRMCSGALFAAQSIRLVLAMVLRRFRARTVDAVSIDRLTRGNIMQSRRGVPMRLEKPTGGAAAAARVRGDIRELVELGGRG